MGKARRARVVRAGILGLVVGVVGFLIVLPSAGAEPASATKGTTLDLSSVPKIHAYLRSLGVDPKTVVIQRGVRNYAGASCPGANWNCTTSTRVVQLSSSTSNGGGGNNNFVCRKDKGSGSVTQDSSPPDQSCLIVQGSGTNSATCNMTTFGSTGTITQACFITQAGSSNTANASLVAGMVSGQGDQEVNQRIEIKQTNGSAGNTLNASETAGLGFGMKANGADVSATQNFRQVVCGNQIATGSGSNTATVRQWGADGAAYLNAGNVDISQNDDDTVSSTCTDSTVAPGGAGAGPFANIVPNVTNDPLACPLPGGSDPYPKAAANSCSRIQQQSASGKNRVTKQEQSNVLAAAVDGASGDTTIDQGESDTGIDSSQDQVSTGGANTIADTQGANQLVSVKHVSGFLDVSQSEDPRCCAAGNQLGGGGLDNWSLNQDVNQRVYVDGQLVDPNSFFTNGAITQFGQDRGFGTTDGNMTINQHASNNVESDSNTASGHSPDITTETFAGGSE